MVVEKKAPLKVAQQSEFMASCNCEDFWRHREYEQTSDEFVSRKGRSVDLFVAGDPVVRYGSVTIPIESRDRRGTRRYEVMLSRGSGDPWACKHIIRALRTRAIMPEMQYKTVVFTEDAARRLERMYQGRLRKRGLSPEVIVTTVNSCYVIGWQNTTKN